jgi:hypothetical protein
MISPGNSHSSRGFSLCFSFCSGPVFCNSELSHSVVASTRFLRCSSASSSWPSVRDSLESFAPLPCELPPSSGVCPLPCVCPSYLGRFFFFFCRPIRFLLSEGSSGPQVPVVLRTDNPCFHSWGWLVIQPPVLSSLTDFLSLGFEGGLSSLSREIWGYLIYEPSCIVFTFFL